MRKKMKILQLEITSEEGKKPTTYGQDFNASQTISSKTACLNYKQVPLCVSEHFRSSSLPHFLSIYNRLTNYVYMYHRVLLCAKLVYLGTPRHGF